MTVVGSEGINFKELGRQTGREIAMEVSSMMYDLSLSGTPLKKALHDASAEAREELDALKKDTSRDLAKLYVRLMPLHDLLIVKHKNADKIEVGDPVGFNITAGAELIRTVMDLSIHLEDLHPSVEGLFKPQKADDRSMHLNEEISRQEGKPEWLTRAMSTYGSIRNGFNTKPAAHDLLLKTRLANMEILGLKQHYEIGVLYHRPMLEEMLGHDAGRQLHADIATAFEKGMERLSTLVNSESFVALCIEKASPERTHQAIQTASFRS